MIFDEGKQIRSELAKLRPDKRYPDQLRAEWVAKTRADLTSSMIEAIAK